MYLCPYNHYTQILSKSQYSGSEYVILFLGYTYKGNDDCGLQNKIKKSA